MGSGRSMIETGAGLHAALVTFAVPHPGLQGDPMICWGILRQLRDAGHRVTVVLLEEPDPHARREQAAMRGPLEAAGIPCVTVAAEPPAARRPHWAVLLRPRLEDFYPNATMAPGTAQAVAALRPDVVIGFDFRALAALGPAGGAPRLGAVPSWNPAAKMGRWRHALPASWSWTYARTTLGLLKLWHEPRFLVELLNRCDAAGHFAAQHAAWAQAHGAPHCRYYRMPLVDPAAPARAAGRSAARRGAKPRFVMVGRLSGTLTLAGLHVFARQMLPEMERRFGADGFEVHIIGRDTLPPALAHRLNRPAVRVRGFVEDLDAELAAADAVLVPNPVNFSFRVRMLTVFAYGCCVIAHEANIAGTPEFVHGENVLLGCDGRALGRLAWEAAQDAGLRARLGQRARATYERWFHPAAEGVGVLEDVERLAERRVMLSEVAG